MCFKKPNCDSVRQIEEEAEEGGGIVFDGGLDVEEDDEYDDVMWGHNVSHVMGMAFGGLETVLTGTMQMTLPSPGAANQGPEWQQSQDILQSTLRTILQSSIRTILRSSLQDVVQSQTLLQPLTLLQSPTFLQTIMDDTAHITNMTWLGGLGWEDIFGDTSVEEMIMEVVREVAREIEAAPGLVRVGVDSEEEEGDASQSLEDTPSMKPPGLIESDVEEDPPSVTGSKEEEEQKPLGLWAEDELDSDDDALLLQAVLELEEQGAPGLEGSLLESKEVDSDEKAILS